MTVCDINGAKGFEVSELLNAKYGDGKTIFVKCDVTNESEFNSEYLPNAPLNALLGINKPVLLD